MKIRIAKESDIPAVSAIYEKIHDEEESGKVTIGWIRGVYPTAGTAKAAIKRGDLFVGEDNGTIVGSAILNRTQVDCYSKGNWEYPCEDSEVMVMHTLTIDPDLSGRGYGKAFLNFYEEYAATEKCKALRLDTNERNIRARVMYRDSGYKEIGIVPCVFNGIPDVQLVMLEKLVFGIVKTACN